MRDLLVATTNPGKMREIRLVLGGAAVRLVTLADLPETASVPPPEESGQTFAENAALKARYYARHTGLPTVAEDSGLVIDALGGRPGIESARYPGATYAEKFANLYRELGPHARPWRARFVCSVVCVGTGRSVEPLCSCEGVVEGEIAAEPRGSRGFGYDPIFFFPPYGGTLGEATDDQKLAVSHRGQAFKKFKRWLESRSDGQWTNPPTF